MLAGSTTLGRRRSRSAIHIVPAVLSCGCLVSHVGGWCQATQSSIILLRRHGACRVHAGADAETPGGGDWFGGRRTLELAHWQRSSRTRVRPGTSVCRRPLLLGRLKRRDGCVRPRRVHHSCGWTLRWIRGAPDAQSCQVCARRQRLRQFWASGLGSSAQEEGSRCCARKVQRNQAACTSPSIEQRHVIPGGERWALFDLR